MRRDLSTPGDNDASERADHDAYYGDDYDRPPSRGEVDREEHDQAGSRGLRVLTGHTHNQLPRVTCVPCITEGRTQVIPPRRAAS